MNTPALEPAVPFSTEALEHIVRRFTWATYGGGLDLDDLRQVGRQAAEEIARARYDADRGAAFTSYAYRIVMQRVAEYANEQRTAVRVPFQTVCHRRQQGRPVPQSACYSTVGNAKHSGSRAAVHAHGASAVDEEINLLDYTAHHTPANDATLDQRRLPWRVEYCLDQVARAGGRGSGPRWAQVLRWVWYDEETLAECGRRLGCTYQRAQQIHDRALDEFARQWALAGWDRP